ncbi:hypothetical protein SRIMM317S_04829 [Streptomyces rimosus subsp. rimosus]
MRQARVLADNVAAVLRGEPVVDYAQKYAGSVASLGLHKGVAHVYGRQLKGYPAWFMHRVYHLSPLGADLQPEGAGRSPSGRSPDCSSGKSFLWAHWNIRAPSSSSRRAPGGTTKRS